MIRYWGEGICVQLGKKISIPMTDLYGNDAGELLVIGEQSQEFMKAVCSAVGALEPEQNTCQDLNDSAWFTIYLIGKWRWYTSKMTSEERGHVASAVERHSARIGDPDEEPIHVRWWND